MATSIATKPLAQLLDLYDLHTQLFANVIVDISKEDSNNRLGTKANHPSWIAGSLLHQRFEMAKLLGVDKRSAYYELFKDYKGIEDKTEYPTVAAYLDEWKMISPIVKELLENISSDTLTKIAPVDMGGEVTYYQAIYFSVDRESYCIGQIGLWRRLLGYDAMKYPG